MRAIPAYLRRMQQILLRRGRTGVETDDLIQQAFLKMHEYCHQGGQVREPEGFLVRTVLRLASNARRDEHRELYHPEPVEELTFLVDTTPTPDEVLDAEQCLNRMRAALDAASSRTREVFLMQRLDGLSYGEIAKLLNISVSAVEKHMAKALVALSKMGEP